MINKEIANIFNRFADIYEIFGDPTAEENTSNSKALIYKIRAYRQAALTLENLKQSLTSLSSKGELSSLPGLGSTLISKIEEYLETKKIKAFEKLKATVPAGLLELLELDSVGPKKVKQFYETLGITNIEELKKGIEDGSVANLPRMGEKSAQKILDSINRQAESNQRYPLIESLATIASIKEALSQNPEALKIQHAGSARRQVVTNGDIDIICATNNPESIANTFKSLDLIDELIAEGPTKISVYLKNGMQTDLRMVKPSEFGAALQYFTGSKAHNVVLRTLAKQKGYKINEYGIYEITSEKRVGGDQEEDIYSVLGMSTPEPETRENTGEIELATNQNLTKLIKLEEIKGDLHIHSTYSDGTNTISEIAEIAIKKGYEYIAISDHSPSLKIAKGVTIDQLKVKKAEIEELNAKLPIKIFFATEVDILSDGSLDYPDEILSAFDLVIASVHSGLQKDTTERLIKAMQNPYVHIIGHPTNRLINKRERSPVDYDKIFATAAKTNTVLEINASPYRLDLDGELIGQAKQYGCKFIINTDSHNINQLDFMPLGVGQAKRGLLETEDVINTLPLKEFTKQISAKSIDK